MRLKILMLLLLLAPALVTVSWPADHGQIREQIQQKKIMLGQSPRDVRMAIGEPTKITKVQTYWESTEDWVYGEGKDAFSFTFREGRLRRIAEGERSVVD
jgi:hypothetical protein